MVSTYPLTLQMNLMSTLSAEGLNMDS